MSKIHFDRSSASGAPSPGDQPEYSVAAHQRAVAASLTPPYGRRNPRLAIHGRDAILAELLSTLDGHGPRVHVLHGLSGSGKSAIALELAHAAAGRGIEVWWAKADDEPTLAEHMLAVARQVGLGDVELSSGFPADHLWRRLAGLPTRWLLVIDNADDPELLAAGTGPLANGCGWLRRFEGSAGTVVALSRCADPRSWAHWCRRHPVEMLEPADAVQILADHVGVTDADAEDAGKLAERLGRLPLALQLAGAYLHEARMAIFPDPAVPTTFAGYLAAIEAGREAVRDPELCAPGSVFIDRAWDMSLQFLRRREPKLTVTVLRLLAGFAAAPISCPQLVNAAALTATGIVGEVTSPQLERAVRSLVDFGLVDRVRSGAHSALSLHPLVRDTAEAEIPLEPAHLAALVTLIRDSEIIRSSPDDAVNWPAWQAVTPHALHLIGLLLRHPGTPAEVTDQACHMAIAAARSMHARGLVLAADAELAKIEQLALRELGPDHPETLRAQHFRAVVLHSRGRWTEALTAYDEIYAARLRVLGPGHGDTLISRHYRAIVVHALGRHGEARTEYEAVLAGRVVLLGAEARLTLATRHNLARLKHDLGQLREAEADYRAVLAAQHRTMGPDYRHTLATRHNLALCLHAQHLLPEAEAEYREVYEIERRLLGDEHPDTLATRANLATLLEARGHPGARAMRDEVYAAQRRALGPDHPESRATQAGQVHRTTRPGPL